MFFTNHLAIPPFVLARLHIGQLFAQKFAFPFSFSDTGFPP